MDTLLEYLDGDNSDDEIDEKEKNEDTTDNTFMKILGMGAMAFTAGYIFYDIIKVEKKDEKE